jgi:hypothetical protein
MFVIRLVMGLLLIWGIAHLVESFHGPPGTAETSAPSRPGPAPKDSVLAGVSLRFKWYPLGFEDLKLADLVIENPTAYTIRDVEVSCEKRPGKTGRAVRESRIVHEPVKPRSVRTFKEFSVGFLHGPDQAASCKVADLVVMEDPVAGHSVTAAPGRTASDDAWDRVQGWFARVLGDAFGGAERGGLRGSAR